MVLFILLGFELVHTTPDVTEKPKAYPPLELPNGKTITNYTITLTFRRAQDLEKGVTPLTPEKLGQKVAVPGQVNFTKESDRVMGENITSNSKGLAGALTNPTKLSFEKGNIEKEYPVEFRGKVWEDAEAAYQYHKSRIDDFFDSSLNMENDYRLMKEIIAEKLKQYPELMQQIEDKGGIEYLESSTHSISEKYDKTSRWTGKGLDSQFIKALVNAYVEAKKTPESVTPKLATVLNVNGVAEVEALAAKGEGINVLRQAGNEHFGNPFTHLPANKTRGAIHVGSIEKAVQAYKDWLNGKELKVANPKLDARRDWILEQISSGALDGKTLLYFKEGYYSHADALADMINGEFVKLGWHDPTLFQLAQGFEGYPEADLELDRALIKFLKKGGFDVKEVDLASIKEEYEVDAIGVADIFNKIIKVAKEGRNIQTLPEETAHVVVETMLGKNAVLDNLIIKINGWSKFDAIYERYKGLYIDDNGNTDMGRIKKEAVAQLISEVIVQKWDIKKNNWFYAQVREIIDHIFKLFKGWSYFKLYSEAGAIADSIIAKNADTKPQAVAPYSSSMVNWVNLIQTKLDAVVERTKQSESMFDATPAEQAEIMEMSDPTESIYFQVNADKIFKTAKEELGKARNSTGTRLFSFGIKNMAMASPVITKFSQQRNFVNTINRTKFNSTKVIELVKNPYNPTQQVWVIKPNNYKGPQLGLFEDENRMKPEKKCT